MNAEERRKKYSEPANIVKTIYIGNTKINFADNCYRTPEEIQQTLDNIARISAEIYANAGLL